MTNIRKISELDIKHISKIIGRDPNDSELDLIEHILSYELEHRNLLAIIDRLNKGAKRKVKENFKLSENSFLQFGNSVKIYQNKKLDFDKSNLIECGIVPLLHNYSLISNEYDTFPIKKEIGSLQKAKSIYFKAISGEKNEIVFISLVGISSNNNSELKNPADHIVQIIEIGKNNKKNKKIIIDLIETLINNELTISTVATKNQYLSKILISELEGTNCGILLKKSVHITDLIINNTDLSILITNNKKNSNKIRSICKKANVNIVQLGEIIPEPMIQLEEKKDLIINLPFDVFDLQYDVNPQHFKEPKLPRYNSSEIIKGVSKTSLSNQLVKLLNKICYNNKLYVNDKVQYDSYCSTAEITDDKKYIFAAQGDGSNIVSLAPRTSAKIVVANAARKVACSGVKPSLIQIHNLFPKNQDHSNWHISELLQGQEEAIRELELTITNRRIDTYDETWQQNVIAFGISKTNEIPQISFKNEGDFISLLGSHRGELGGTDYQRYISTKNTATIPTVDLNMERRLQDVVQQGVNTKLLNSATNVSLGGISIAVAMSLVASDKGVGAKIHLSRKLSDEELLFGETQGLVIVTLSEEDIMEFERICMTVGVPSTTIGRVTMNDIYTFNDTINIKVDNLRKAVA